MQVSLNDLKRKKICPILHAKGWDYSGKDPRSEFFQLCIREMMRWYYRKGRGISYDILPSIVSCLASQGGIDRLDTTTIQFALKNFTNSGIYSKIEDVIANYEIQVGIGDGHVIKHIVPTVSTLKDNTCIITWNDRVRSPSDLRQSYETRLSAVWSFYSLNQYPVFYNLYLNEDKVEQVRYKPNQFYIRDSKKFLLKMKGLVEDKGVYPAPVELCQRCERRLECQTEKTRTKNWQKSW